MRRDGEGTERRGPAIGARQVVAVVVLVLVLVFVFQNTDEATISFLWAEFDAPLWVALLGSFAAGLVVGGLMARSRRL